MKVKTGSNIDLEKNKSVENQIMQKFGSVEDANIVLTEDGMFGYVINDGIYLNILGVVSNIASLNTTTPNARTFYQSNTPVETVDVGTLWYNTASAILNIWTNTDWLPIGGNVSAPLSVWETGETYAPNTMVLYTGNLYYNSTGNIISTTTFLDADWTILTGQPSKQYTLPQTFIGGVSIGDLALSSDSLVWTINHNLEKSYPTVVLVKSTTQELVTIQSIIYNTNNQITLTTSDTLDVLGYSLIVKIT